MGNGCSMDPTPHYSPSSTTSRYSKKYKLNSDGAQATTKRTIMENFVEIDLVDSEENNEGGYRRLGRVTNI